MASRVATFAHLRQSAQDLLPALNRPCAGQYVIAPQALPTQGPHPPVVQFNDPALRRHLLRIVFLGAMRAEHASDKAWVHHHRGLSPGSGHMHGSRHVSDLAGVLADLHDGHESRPRSLRLPCRSNRLCDIWRTSGLSVLTLAECSVVSSPPSVLMSMSCNAVH